MTLSYKCLCVLHWISQSSWRSDRTCQRTQQGVVLPLSDTGLCLDCKHPADWLNHTTTPELEMIQKAYNCDTQNKSSSKLYESIKNSHLWSYRRKLNWKLQKSQDRRTVFLLIHSFLLPLIQTLPLFYQQIFRVELNLLMTADYFPKCLVVRLYNSHEFTSIWPAAGGYFHNLRGSSRNDDLNVKYSSWMKLQPTPNDTEWVDQMFTK